jgi:hypothetical protein
LETQANTVNITAMAIATITLVRFIILFFICSCFPFPRWFIPQLEGPEEAKNLAGEERFA